MMNGSSSNNSSSSSSSKFSSKSSSTTIANMNKSKKTPEYMHVNTETKIIMRPESYGGSRYMEEETNVYDYETKQIIPTQHTIKIIVKTFEEILENASDAIQKNKKKHGTFKTTEVNITMNQLKFSIRNNGDSIPIKKMNEQDGFQSDACKEDEANMYIPEVMYGVLNSGSNFVKTNEGAGQNGVGAKLTNVFSSSFNVVIQDGTKRYEQLFEWREEESILSLEERKRDAVVTENTGSPFVEIQWEIRKDVFTETKQWKNGITTEVACESIPDGVYQAIRQRVYHMKLTHPSVKWTFNGTEIDVTATQYCAPLIEEGLCQLYETTNETVLVGLAKYTDRKKNIKYESNVNGIHVRGGLHITHIKDSILNHYYGTKEKLDELIEELVDQKLFIYVNAFVLDPRFKGGNKKAYLQTYKHDKTTKLQVNKKFVQDLFKQQPIEKILEDIKQELKAKELRKVNKSNRVNDRMSIRRNVPNLVEANVVDKKSRLCIVEGNSAMNLIRAIKDHLPEQESKRIGMIAKRGKVFNCDGKNPTQISKSHQDLIQTLGLQFGKGKSRYGEVIICTDADADGFHITGLLCTLFASDTKWVEKLLQNGYVKVLKTPIVKVFDRQNRFVKAFYTMPEYEAYAKNQDMAGKTPVYYKGLGSHDNDDAKWLAQHFEAHLIRFEFDNMSVLHDCFKKQPEFRKQLATTPYAEQQHATKTCTITQYAHGQYKLYLQYDNSRKLHSPYDGLNTSKRKLIWYLMHRGNQQPSKVYKISAGAASKLHYLHGDKSFQDTLTKLAQTIVGKENMQYCVPKGQFGQRHINADKTHGAAAARYIDTCLQPWVSLVYPKKDFPLLKYHTMEGEQVEPVSLFPIVPMILINGCRCVGTGFAQNIPPHDPRDVIDVVRCMIEDKREHDDPNDELDALVLQLYPYFKGFKGALEYEGRWLSTGAFTYDENTCALTITELPLFTWTDNYIQNVLMPLCDDNDNPNLSYLIEKFTENHTQTSVEFEIQLGRAMNEEEIWSVFKLRNPFLTKQTEVWTILMENGVPKTLGANPRVEILNMWFEKRHDLYVKRKQLELQEMETNITELRSKRRFISLSIEKVIPTLDPDKTYVEKREAIEAYNSSSSSVVEVKFLDTILMKMFSKDKIEELDAQIEQQDASKQALENTDVEDIWLREIDAFESHLLRDMNWCNLKKNDNPRMTQMVNDYTPTTKIRKKKKRKHNTCDTCGAPLERSVCKPCIETNVRSSINKPKKKKKQTKNQSTLDQFMNKQTITYNGEERTVIVLDDSDDE